MRNPQLEERRALLANIKTADHDIGAKATTNDIDVFRRLDDGGSTKMMATVHAPAHILGDRNQVGTSKLRVDALIGDEGCAGPQPLAVLNDHGVAEDGEESQEYLYQQTDWRTRGEEYAQQGLRADGNEKAEAGALALPSSLESGEAEEVPLILDRASLIAPLAPAHREGGQQEQSQHRGDCIKEGVEEIEPPTTDAYCESTAIDGENATHESPQEASGLNPLRLAHSLGYDLTRDPARLREALAQWIGR